MENINILTVIQSQFLFVRGSMTLYCLCQMYVSVLI